MGYAKLQLRRDTAANWTSANPVLAEGELAVETDTMQFKIGDGTTAWTSLDYGAEGTPGEGVPAGGTTGQVLTKINSTDYNTQWSDPSGGGGMTWSVVSADTAMVAGNGYIVSGAHDMTIPTTVSAGDEFVVHALDATVRVVSNGNVIALVGSGNNLTVAAGETAHIVANAAGALEIV